MEKLFELNEVSKRFSLGGRRSHEALKHINLSIYKGETLGILGESGSGKSTLSKIIMGVYPPTEGQVQFHGQNLELRSQRQRKSFAQSAQMIFQDPYMSLDPHMTVKSIIAENLEIQGKLDKIATEKRVYELLKMTGLRREYAHRFPHEFSGGQRQRISIARALATEPEFIICDEPVSALDYSIRGQIMNLLARLKRELGLTYLFISHDLAVLRSFSDRIMVMRSGEILEVGSAEEICSNPQHPYTRMLLDSVLPVKL